MWYKNIAGSFFGLVTKHACDGQTDRRTDRQNYDSQDRASIAASRGKNYYFRPTRCHAVLPAPINHAPSNHVSFDQFSACRSFEVFHVFILCFNVSLKYKNMFVFKSKIYVLTTLPPARRTVLLNANSDSLHLAHGGRSSIFLKLAMFSMHNQTQKSGVTS